MNPVSAVDAFLARRGFGPGPIRKVVLADIFLSLFLLILGAGLFPITRQIWWLGLAAGLGTWNFFSMAYVIPMIVKNTLNLKAVSNKIMVWQLLGANLRLFFTGIIIYMFLVRFDANVFALIIGLSVTVLTIPPVMFLCRAGENG